MGRGVGVLLRAFGGMRRTSDVFELGCGLGHLAFALRYFLRGGTYHGLEIVCDKVEWLQATFTPRHSRSRFSWADLHNTHYNPTGTRMWSGTHERWYDSQDMLVLRPVTEA